MVIDCKSIADKLIQQIKLDMVGFERKPTMKCIIVGENGGAESYLKMISKTFSLVEFNCEIIRLPVDSTNESIINLISNLNLDNMVDAIMVQMPLPDHIDKNRVLYSIDPNKDPDGFHPVNVGKLLHGEESIKPCTPQAVVHIIKSIGIDLCGKNVVVIGRSDIVGKPLSLMLLKENATVTICHSKTRDISGYTKKADIVVVAVGKPKFLKSDMISMDSVVIDVGTNRVNGKMVGDAESALIESEIKYITPVPGGVGRVTNAFLLKNVLDNYKKHI